jgi:bacterioferritin
MKAKEGVINILNESLTADLTAINQYFVHAKMCENWGYERLHHNKVRERSLDEIRCRRTHRPYSLSGRCAQYAANERGPG